MRAIIFFVTRFYFPMAKFKHSIKNLRKQKKSVTKRIDRMHNESRSLRHTEKSFIKPFFCENVLNAYFVTVLLSETHSMNVTIFDDVTDLCNLQGICQRTIPLPCGVGSDNELFCQYHCGHVAKDVSLFIDLSIFYILERYSQISLVWRHSQMKNVALSLAMTARIWRI